jgi:bifunctional DNA-binding transcriptional regulator/antitoxin component of YhaV-PrlF toxin-antitoxin module
MTLPKSVRDRLDIEGGDRLDFIESEEGFRVAAATRDIRSLKGIVGRAKKTVTLEDMNNAIEKMGRTP